MQICSNVTKYLSETILALSTCTNSTQFIENDLFPGEFKISYECTKSCKLKEETNGPHCSPDNLVQINKHK